MITSWFDPLTRMSKTTFPSKMFKKSFSIQLHLLPQLRQLLALLSPKAKMPKVPQRLYLAEGNALQCLPLPPLPPHQNLLLPQPLGHPCNLPLLPHLLVRVTALPQKLSRQANKERVRKERHLCLFLPLWRARSQEQVRNQ